MNCLSQLSIIGDVSEKKFNEQFDAMKQNGGYYIIAIEDQDLEKVVGVGSLFVELKFLRGCSKAGHIEDIVVNDSQRGKNFGRRIIDQLKYIGTELGCYKIILNCKQNNTGFYEKCGFTIKDLQMTRYNAPRKEDLTVGNSLTPTMLQKTKTKATTLKVAASWATTQRRWQASAIRERKVKREKGPKPTVTPAPAYDTSLVGLRHGVRHILGYPGGEIYNSKTFRVCVTKGAFDELDPRSLHMLGMHGSASANLAMQKADVIIALGARFDDRVTGHLNHFAPEAKKAAKENRGGIIHFEISPKNINKVVQANAAVEEFSERKEWFSLINEWKTKYPWHYKKPATKDARLKPQQIIEELDRQMQDYKEKVMLTTGIGQHQMWAAQSLVISVGTLVS
ncbi:hypothetical protein G9A89_019726 [Geosiphon pyriformis]|nr:hypothetical protein G9A89_019726 [Geosiphon pyriformis]